MTDKDTTLTRLEEEGDLAADYLEGLLDICDLDGDIDIDVENDRAAVEVVSEEYGDRWLKRLVGEDGRVLDALQELTRLAVQTKTGERSRLMLDIAGHRAGVKARIAEEGREAVGEVERTGEAVRLRAMNPFERKVVHDVAKAANLRSESDGAEPNRRVVILAQALGDGGEGVSYEELEEVEELGADLGAGLGAGLGDDEASAVVVSADSVDADAAADEGSGDERSGDGGSGDGGFDDGRFDHGRSDDESEENR